MEIAENVHGFFWRAPSPNNCNTYLIDGYPRILIDPGHLQLFGHVEQGLRELGLSTADIDVVICTHAHPDHVEAVARFNHATARWALHEAEWRFVQSLDRFVRSALGLASEETAPHLLLTDGDLTVGDRRLRILHTPGHSPGSVAVWWPERQILFTGDVVFYEGVGRTDLPGGNAKDLAESIRRLSDLKPRYLLPGHGPMIGDRNGVDVNFRFVRMF